MSVPIGTHTGIGRTKRWRSLKGNGIRKPSKMKGEGLAERKKVHLEKSGNNPEQFRKF